MLELVVKLQPFLWRREVLLVEIETGNEILVFGRQRSGCLYRSRPGTSDFSDRFLLTIRQSCGVGVKAGVGVSWSRPSWPESESDLESANFANSDSGPESPINISSTDNQNTLITAMNANNYIRPKTLEYFRLRKKGEWQDVYEVRCFRALESGR